MKIPQYIITFRALTVGITLVIMACFLIGDVVGPLIAMLNAI